MDNMLTIFKKEMYRVLTDRRLILTIFIMPGLAIFVMYSLIGTLVQNQATAVEEHTIILYEENMPDAIRLYLEQLSDESNEQRIHIEFRDQRDYDEETLKAYVREGDIDIVLLFEDDFHEKILNYTDEEPPTLTVFYNYGRQQSSFSYNNIMPVIEYYRNTYLIERLEDPAYYQVFSVQYVEGIVDERVLSGQMMAMMLPMLIVIFLFAGAMSIGPDSIAGEKERGTIATLLVTPIKRREIAFGKVLSLGMLSFISALSSFVGIALSLPRLMQMDDSGVSYAIYTMTDYVVIFSILIATVLVIVGLISVISAFAKTIKEAQMFIMPFYFITLIIGIVTSFGAEPSQSMWVHFMPIYGAVNLLSGVFTFQWLMINYVIVLVSSVVYTMMFIYALTLMFNDEKIMFQK